jgi:hypothetical protein
MSFPLNCDSGTFMNLATEPGRLFDERGRMWQSRPLFILSARLLSRPFTWVVGSSGDLAVWLGFVSLNFLLVVAALVLFHRFVAGDHSFSWPTFLVASLLLSNDVFKAHFWTPHTQIFNILVPVVAMSACLLWLRSDRISSAGAVALGLASGLAALAYGSFALVVAAVAFASLWRGAAARPRLVGACLARASLTVACFFGPIVLWAAFVTWHTGSFYSHEVEQYRQFVWILDAMRAGPTEVLARTREVMAAYSHDWQRAVGPSIALLGSVGLLATWTVGPRFRFDRRSKQAILAAVIVLITTSVFFAALGYSAPRLAWGGVPPILAITGLLTGVVWRVGGWRRMALLLFLAALASASLAWQIVKTGPFS